MKSKKLKSIIALLTAVGLMAGCVSGCGKKDEKTSISIGGWPTKAGTDLDNYEKNKSNYEQLYSNVSIVPDTWAFDLQTFYPKAEAGLLPNIFYSYLTELPKIINGEYAADITDALKENGYKDAFNEKVLNTVSKDGKIYAFPWAAYVLGLGYNTELFEKAGLMNADGTPKQPKNWDEVVDFAVKIKAATGKPGIIFPTSNNFGGWIFTPFAWSYGVEFMKQDSNGKWKATFNSDNAVKALEYIKDLKWKYGVLAENMLVDGEEYYKSFATGDAGMLIAAGDLPNYVSQYEMSPDKVGMMAMPAGPSRHVTLLGGAADIISSKSSKKQVDACIKWFDVAGKGNKLTDSSKESIEKNIKSSIDKGQLIGVKSMQVWSGNSEIVEYTNSLIDKYANSQPNHVKLYNDFVNDKNVEVQVEEPVCAQDLYGILDNCIQEVLINENADCKEIIAKANDSFQRNYLDNIDN